MGKSEEKKSFKLYNDYIDHINLLSDEDAGKLFKAILSHVNGLPEIELDGVAMMAYSFIRSQLVRDEKKYDERCEKNRENGRRGGRPKNSSETTENQKADGNYENHSVMLNTEGSQIAMEESQPLDVVNEETPIEQDPPNEPKEKKRMEYPTDFEAFWRVYPRPTDKGGAYKKYKARINDGWSPQELCRAASNYRNEVMRNKTEQRFIKHAKTFLGDAQPFVDYLRTGQGGTGAAPGQVSKDEQVRNGENPFDQFRR